MISFARSRWLLVSIALAAAPARADLFITIVDGGGTAPVTADGGGTLFAIAEAAALYWETALSASSAPADVDFSITITVSWGTPGVPTASATGGHGLVFPPFPGGTYSGTGTIVFNTSGHDFWMDPTPLDNSEWTGSVVETSADLGGGSMVVGRVFDTPTAGPSGEEDALTVMLHEMGHALGYLDFGTGIDPYGLAVGTDGDIDVDGTSYPHSGATLPITSGHWTTGGSLDDSAMEGTFLVGTRVLLSAADILGMAEFHGFTAEDIDTSPSVVPEPSSLVLTGLAVVGIAWRKRRALLARAP